MFGIGQTAGKFLPTRNVLNLIQKKNAGMRMVVFSLILLAIILFRREGIMGTREITWKTIFSLGRRKA